MSENFLDVSVKYRQEVVCARDLVLYFEYLLSKSLHSLRDFRLSINVESPSSANWGDFEKIVRLGENISQDFTNLVRVLSLPWNWNYGRLSNDGGDIHKLKYVECLISDVRRTCNIISSGYYSYC